MLLLRASTGCDGRDLGGGRCHAVFDLHGQGTLEYALVLFAFMSMVAGLGALWRTFDVGLPVEHALQSASHHIASVAPGAFADVFVY